MKANVLTSNYYHTLKEWRRDSKSFIFESVFEFIVIASDTPPQRLSYHCARFHFYGNRAICIKAFKSILIMSVYVYIYQFEIIMLHSLLSKLKVSYTLS